MDPQDIITIQVALLNPQGGQVGGEVRIRDEFAFSKFNDRHINQMIFDNERRQGNMNIKYDTVKDLIIEKFPGLTKEHILEKIMKEIKANGGRVK